MNLHESKEMSKIPITGRIGRLAQVIERETNQDVLLEVMQGVDQCGPGPVEKASWIKGAVERLERLVGKEKSASIMEACGRKCCGATYRKSVQKVMSESESLEAFLTTLNKKGLGGGRLTLKDAKTITGGYNHCYCGQVKKTKDVFPILYCSCSVGWYKQLFESALGRPVEVEILQSIIAGAHTCEFVIRL